MTALFFCLRRMWPTSWLVGLLCLWALPAWSQLTFLPSTQAGFTTQTYTNAALKTIDFNTVTLANATGLTYATTLGSSGGAFSSTLTTNTATGFSGNSMQVTSGTGSAAGSKVAFTFTGGTPYISFLWNLRTGDSDNTVKFNLSNGTSVSVSNCATTTTTCVGGYDTYNFFTSMFSLIFGSTAQSSTQTARLVYQPPSGVTVSSMELSAVRYNVCTLIIFCNYESRYFSADAISYVDNSAAVASGLHHLEILSDSNTTITCQTSKFKVRACANASCSSNYTAGVTGSLALAGSGVSFPNGAGFSIPAGTSISSAILAKTTSIATLVAGASSVTPAPTATGYCGLGAPASKSASSCDFTVRSTGMSLSLPDHRSGTSQNLKLNFVKELLGSCTALGSGAASVEITATYSGSTMPTVAGSALISGVPKSFLVTFDLLGATSLPFQFNNSGPVTLDVSVLSVASSLLSSAVNLTSRTVSYVAPAAFKVEPVVSGVTGVGVGVVGAGNTMQLKISALNSLSTPSVTSNYGSETGLDPIAITRSLLKPSTRKSGAVNNPAPTIGSIVFNNGVALVDFTWTEVGTLDITATLADYLDTGMSVSGAISSTVSPGMRFVPDSFAIAPTAKCGAFTYAGQPFSAVLTAINATGATTLNYDGSQALAANRTANAVTIAALSGATGGSFGSGGTVAATAFGDGTATGTLTYTMANKLTAPNTVVLQATDPDVTDSSNPSMLFRSGRIKLANAFGSESLALQIPIQVQYWSAKAWVPASDDTCTNTSVLNTTHVVRSNFLTHQGGVSTALGLSTPSALTLAAGTGGITLGAPGAKKTGSVDVSLDLSSTAANLPWLQSLDAACGSGVLCNPKARATFGVYTPESKKTIHIQNVN